MEKKHYQRIALLFPGQGAQYPGMAKDFVETFSAARLTFEEADSLLSRPLSKLILKGSEEELTQTVNSQPAIYTASMAIFRVFKELFEEPVFACAGLSLGEYTALTAGETLSFMDALPLVQRRAQLMQEASEKTEGRMAALLGLSNEAVEALVNEINMPEDLFVANYNCPGQVVLSGSIQGIERGIEEAKKRGAKRALPLQVSGAFHSGLMQSAEKNLAPYIQQVPLVEGEKKIVMNVTGDFASSLPEVRSNLIAQVTRSVRWAQGIEALLNAGVDLFIEFGPGKTLSGMMRKMETNVPVLSLEKVEDVDKLHQFFMGVV
ncbi:MAG: ACP S-malonyltransferase [Parachlamydia sp.]|jgi:[acyl-carrier-protein] S-malonyltransferase|nr:ACP S-malonyltransferase [Parachlamydia sp.]